jgi:hypothetical protein
MLPPTEPTLFLHPTTEEQHGFVSTRAFLRRRMSTPLLQTPTGVANRQRLPSVPPPQRGILLLTELEGNFKPRL